jgi:hypothetical protein
LAFLQVVKYGNTHKIVIGGDINKDLNKATNNKRGKYLWEFINDCHLKFNNTAKTFTNAMGKECSEIYYFLHNLSTYSNQEVIDTIVENTSDHHPIRMVFKFEHKAYKNECRNVQKTERKIKWEKVNKDPYFYLWFCVVSEFSGRACDSCVLHQLTCF